MAFKFPKFFVLEGTRPSALFAARKTYCRKLIKVCGRSGGYIWLLHLSFLADGFLGVGYQGPDVPDLIANECRSECE